MEDTENSIADLAKLFFHELAKKVNDHIVIANDNTMLHPL